VNLAEPEVLPILERAIDLRHAYKSFQALLHPVGVFRVHVNTDGVHAALP
jgi:hypothetical protein